MPGDLIPCSLFLIGILTSVAADCRLRRVDAAPWANGCITAAGRRPGLRRLRGGDAAEEPSAHETGFPSRERTPRGLARREWRGRWARGSWFRFRP